MKASPWVIAGGLALIGLSWLAPGSHAGEHTSAGPPQAAYAPALNPTPPSQPVKLIFIHHSTGENWLAGGNGNLGMCLV